MLNSFKAHIVDSLSPIKTFAFVDEKTKQDAILRMPSEEAAMQYCAHGSNETANLAIDSKVKTERSHSTSATDKVNL